MSEINAADTENKSIEWLVTFFRRLFHSPLGTIGFFIVIIVIAAALSADWIAPYDPIKIDVRSRLQSPTLEHLLGTDHLGRDNLSRMLSGTQIAMKVAFFSISMALGLGILFGLIAGFGPRWLDQIALLMFDTIRSFPTIMLALVLVTLVGSGVSTIIFVIVLTTFPVYGRIVRTQTQAIRDDEFILAERALGVGILRIMGVHILPNIIGPLLIIASMDVPIVITVEAGLSFLGLGVRPPAPSWGSILNDGYDFIRNTPWIVFAGGMPLVLTTLGFTFLGESLRDIFDPKLRKDL